MPAISKNSSAVLTSVPIHMTSLMTTWGWEDVEEDEDDKEDKDSDDSNDSSVNPAAAVPGCGIEVPDSVNSSASTPIGTHI